MLLFVLLVYYLTLFPGPGGRVNAGDSLKWQFIGKVAGTPHPTGYPLFVVFTIFFSKLPLSIPLCLKINLLSTIFAMLTLIFIYKTLMLLTSHHFSSLITTLIFAFGRIFWSQATEAEVYSLNSFFITIILFLLLKWNDKNNEKFLFISVFTLILSLSNHITILLHFPAFLIFVLLKDYKSLFRKRTIFISVLAIFLLVFLYLFLIWRSNSSLYSEFPIRNLKDLFYFLSGAYWKKSITFSFYKAYHEILHKFIPTIHENITIPSILFLIFGIIHLSKNLRTFLLIFIPLILFLIFPSVYSIRDIEVNFIPIYLFSSFFIGAGINFFMKLKTQKILKIFLTISLTFVPLFLLISNFKSMKVPESYWGEWIKMVFSHFKRDTIFIPDYINYDQDMALSYGVFGLDFIKNNNFVIGAHIPEREKIIQNYLRGNELYFRGVKIKKGGRIVCFDESIANKLSHKFEVRERTITNKNKIRYFTIQYKRD